MQRSFWIVTPKLEQNENKVTSPARNTMKHGQAAERRPAAFNSDRG
jgi:hypothetical protein